MDEGSAVMSKTRALVIKRLQEELEDLKHKNYNAEALEARYKTLEKMFQLSEKQWKLKLDDLEYINESLEGENRNLRDALTKLQNKIVKTINVEKKVDQNKLDIWKEKANKWKLKYRALESADPNARALLEKDKLDITVQTMTAELEALKAELAATKQQKQKVVNQLEKANNTLKFLSGMVKDYDDKNADLKTKNNKLLTEMQKAAEIKKQKENLLNHSRSKEAQRQKELKEKEKRARLAEEQSKQHIAEKDQEVDQIQQNLESEVKQRKKVEKKLKNAIEDHKATVSSLQEEIEILKDENNTLRQSMQEISQNASSIKDKFDLVQQQKSSLEQQLARADKYRIKSEQLQKTVTELQATVNNITGDISTVTAQTASQYDDLKVLLTRHNNDYTPGNWAKDMNFIGQKFQELAQAHSEINQLDKQIAKQNRTIDEKTRMINEKDSKINELNNQVQQLSDALTARGKVVQFNSDQVPRTQIPMDGRSEKSYITIPQNNIVLNLINFRSAVARKIDTTLFEVTNTIREINEMISPTESTSPSCRSLVLSMAFLTRWIKFDSLTEFDNSTILNFSGNPNLQKPHPIYDLKERVKKLLENKSQVENSCEAAETQASKLNQEIVRLKSELESTRSSSDTNSAKANAMQLTVSTLENQVKSMVPKLDYIKVQKELENKTVECRNISDQLSELKSEMNKLLNTIDNNQQISEEQRISIITLNESNEVLQQKLEAALKELNTCQLTLKEKTREILALERRLSKIQGQVAIVKDTIPMTEQPKIAKFTIDSKRSAFFINDVVRDDLEQMKLKLLSQNEMY
ncbi:hypothetical protein TVAG_059370 [Trichomonas vaginalis G3]|uniref:Uncharacterized protein n=1 Tax=Trichomonas vaginalis (strain ATCC PRA-98 / G3) TaxID=412133 RepID=A2ERL2_TRIV3|nr:hypothetical protein TVAGG3_0285260 [Trichomonas vaginalis G3]EAY04739.1 hypothetical protein TVAG_059370 [Trichomonas vaginalis G3]KAI5526847.1 hypothetical protein TVAGG3_0285260 [Trichomonas vaginalis G3]|eukprot:XP_001316962.1 hypothetical protein [Trichomonas vaginalis G3]